MVCRVDLHQSCEHFIARAVPEGGYFLLMKHGGEKLRFIGSKEVDGEKRLAKVEGDDGIVWDFVKV
jgi:hypothetical protein